MRAGELLMDAITRVRPHLVVVDDSDFPSGCQTALDRISPERVMVVGPEPDLGYRSLALANGSGAWGAAARWATTSAPPCARRSAAVTRAPRNAAREREGVSA
jgi:hypothetical protein